MKFDLRSFTSILLAGICGFIALRLLPEVVTDYWSGFIAYLAVGPLSGGLVRFFDMLRRNKIISS